MLKLLCGPSGSGKTTRLINQICNDIKNGIKCYLLVPEQQAYISEMDILSSLPHNAGLFFEIVNFSGLAEDVFREYGVITAASVNHGIRSLFMWNTLRELAPMLRQFGKSARSDMSLTKMMLSTVDELKSAGIDAEALEQAASLLEKNSPLQKKLSDVAAVTEAFSHTVKNTLGDDQSDKLLRLAEKLKEHRYFEGTHIYIDSFTDFTVPEYRVLQEIMLQADFVTVSLCTDRLLSDLPHFETAKETAKQLSKIAARLNLEMEKEILPNGKLNCPKTLQIIEKNLWRFDLRREDRTLPPIGERDVLHMTVCNNLYEESEAAALHILELIQGGMHYGDIAVVVRDSEAYRGVIDAAMERHGIPYFFSERTDLSSKPLVRLILSALNAIEKNYRLQDVIALIKTGLSGVLRRDAALFEEYCQTWHISGSRFTEERWSMNPDGLVTTRSARAEEILEIANRVRSAVIPPLQILSAEIRASKSVHGKCKAIYDYLNRIDIRGQLLNRAKEEAISNQTREAGETVRLYKSITRLLSDMVGFLPDAELTNEEFIAALTILFSTSDLGSVPNSHDCVTIGSADLMRVEKIRVSFLLGLCEGDFPKAISEDSLFSEADKTELKNLGIELGKTSHSRSSEELFYVYRAMTKPTEKLYLSTVTSQPDGTVKTPSLAFSRIRFLLDAAPQEFDLDRVRAATQIQSMTPAKEVLSTLSAPNGSTLRLSQSKIQTFLQCPYRYYATYVLKMRDQKDATPSYSDDGTFLHYVFEHFLRSARQSDGSLLLPADDMLEAITDRILEEYLSEICPFPLEDMDSRLLHLFSRLRLLALRILKNMIEELRCSRFLPHAFEQDIGALGENGLPPFVIELKNGSRVFLAGKVDRIDILDHDGRIYFRIIDYKSGKHEFSVRDVKIGMEIQLILYLFSVLASNPTGLIPAGAQYLYAAAKDGKADVFRSGFVLDEQDLIDKMDSTEDRRYTASLLHKSAEEIVQLGEEMKTAVSEVADRILCGQADKTPSEAACKYCPIRSHCDRAYHK